MKSMLVSLDGATEALGAPRLDLPFLLAYTNMSKDWNTKSDQLIRASCCIPGLRLREIAHGIFSYTRFCSILGKGARQPGSQHAGKVLVVELEWIKSAYTCPIQYYLRLR